MRKWYVLLRKLLVVEGILKGEVTVEYKAE